jgi:NTP pyrophosphatase (non-canonical NTP hydrolase)
MANLEDNEFMNEALTISEMCKESHQTALSHGWWDEPREFGTQLMLMVTELSEVMEDYRINNLDPTKYLFYDEKGKPCGIASEFADVLIRIGDTCARYGIDLESAIKIKMEYNKTISYRHGNKIC